MGHECPPPETRSRSQPKAEAQVDGPAAADVRAGAAEVFHQLARRSGLLEGVGQHRESDRFELAAGQLSFIVCRSGQRDDGGRGSMIRMTTFADPEGGAWK